MDSVVSWFLLFVGTIFFCVYLFKSWVASKGKEFFERKTYGEIDTGLTLDWSQKRR